MWIQLQERQTTLKLEISKRDKELRKQKILEEQLETVMEKKKIYLTELKAEQKDVDNLDRFSIINMIRTWTGKQDEAREKELFELATVEAKFREVEKMLSDLERDARDNEMELQKLDWQLLDLRWEQLIKEKKQWIFQNNEEEARKLEQLYEEKTIVVTSIREIEEALAAGKKAKLALKKALKSLNSAEGYSTWDTFLGGGLLATALKHSELNESENAIHEAQLALQRFQTELLDVQQIQATNLMVERDTFVTFADYVFDDIFSAWSIHSKINASVERIERTVSELSKICTQLEEMKNVSEENRRTVESNIEQILER